MYIFIVHNIHTCLYFYVFNVHILFYKYNSNICMCVFAVVHFINMKWTYICFLPWFYWCCTCGSTDTCSSHQLFGGTTDTLGQSCAFFIVVNLTLGFKHQRISNCLCFKRLFCMTVSALVSIANFLVKIHSIGPRK